MYSFLFQTNNIVCYTCVFSSKKFKKNLYVILYCFFILGLSRSRQTPAKTEQNKIQKPQNINTASTEGNVFRYDFENNESANSESTTYSNLSSPSSGKNNANPVPIIIVPPPPPPLVYRELKPGRKNSDSNLNNEISPTVNRRGNDSAKHVGPSINRKLKPAAKLPNEGK